MGLEPLLLLISDISIALVTRRANSSSDITEMGLIAEFSFGKKYHNKMRISKLDKNRGVEWQVLEAHKEWLDTRITFNLQNGDNTILRFWHRNWREKTDFFAHCNYNWA